MAQGDGLQNRYSWVRLPPPPVISLYSLGYEKSAYYVNRGLASCLLACSNIYLFLAKNENHYEKLNLTIYFDVI